MKTLYLRIYLTVLAVLLVFALAAGWMAHTRVERELDSARSAWTERAAAWGELLENSLPPATADEAQQRAALLEWAERLHLPLALEDASGRRIATSPRYAHREEDHPAVSQIVVPIRLSDGRVLQVLRPAFGDRRPPPPDIDGPRAREPGRGPADHPPGFHAGDARPPRGEPRSPPPFGGIWPGAWPWLAGGTGLVAALLVLFVAIAAGAYPVVRRLTRRLETLRRGVEAFGGGDLTRRVDPQGHDEVAALATSFNQAAQRIESLVRSNRSLLANASHELRSPLARLKMAVAMLPDAAPERAETLRQEIHQDIRELDALVEEVLLASRLDADTPLQRESVDLLGLALEEARRVEAEVDGEALSVQGDERLLRRALRNLLENARRYGAGKPIRVRVERSGERARVQVQDQGAGVPEDQRERIFEAFYRLPGHAELDGGVGLGLSLVRQIAQRHGGSVRCEAAQPGGSLFTLELPM